MSRRNSWPPRPFDSQCCWPACEAEPRTDLPVCPRHAERIHAVLHDEWLDKLGLGPLPEGVTVPTPLSRPAIVYYLRVGPYAVKIGTTIHLRDRLNALRTEVQHVMAVEPGGYQRESERHKQFAAERLGKREDFRLTPRLQAHIDALNAAPACAALIATHTRDHRSRQQ